MLSTVFSVVASTALLAAQGVSAQAFSQASSSGGLSINPPSTNPTTCDPTTISYTFTGNSSWPVTIALTNGLVNQAPLGAPKTNINKPIYTGLPATGNTPANVNWTVDVPEGYYVLLAEARPYDDFPNNYSFTVASASTTRFQVVNGSSVACIYGTPPDTSSHVNVGAIVGGVIGGLALLALLAIAACCLIKRRKNSKRSRMASAIPIEERKAAKDEKSFDGAVATGIRADPFTNPSTVRKDAVSTVYDEDSTRAGSTHTEEPSTVAHHQGLADPFADPTYNNGDYLPSQRSSGLDPDNQAFADLHTQGGHSPSANSMGKSLRKPAPEYDGVEEESPRVTPHGSQPHLLMPDTPNAI